MKLTAMQKLEILSGVTKDPKCEHKKAILDLEKIICEIGLPEFSPVGYNMTTRNLQIIRGLLKFLIKTRGKPNVKNN